MKDNVIFLGRKDKYYHHRAKARDSIGAKRHASVILYGMDQSKLLLPVWWVPPNHSVVLGSYAHILLAFRTMEKNAWHLWMSSNGRTMLLTYEWGVENMKTNALHSRQVKSANGQLLERQKPVIVFLTLLVKHKVSRKVLKQEVCRYIYAKVYFDSSSFLPDDLFSKKVSSRSLSAVNQMVIPRPRSELRRHSLRYRRPVV